MSENNKANKHQFVTLIFFSLLLLVVVVWLGAQVFWPKPPMARDYVLTTGSKGGTFYPVGEALSTMVQAKVLPKHNLSLSVRTSAGSGENIQLLKANEAQFAIINGLYGKLSLTQPNKLLAVSMLWPNVEQFVVKTELATTATMADLQQTQGLTFSIGRKGSGTAESGQRILSGLGINIDDFELTQTSYAASVYSMRNNEVEVMNIPSGIPTPAITRAFASMGRDITMLNFTDQQLEQVNSDFKLWSRYVIPANTYPGQTESINTISQPNILVANADVAAADVYLLTKSIYQNLAFLNNIHPATRAMTLQKAFDDLPIPLHPGAIQFYQEAGLTVPQHLFH